MLEQTFLLHRRRGALDPWNSLTGNPRHPAPASGGSCEVLFSASQPIPQTVSVRLSPSRVPA
ncbi:hypothetical protein LZ30DRAFT_728020 [Colletotrichum cereale]|nr:hypothetical protein LZ30DRAFT_728020 [Colletotrichum cereale]